MIDHMLLHGGWGTSLKCSDFVKKYNASVFYDKSLQLVDHAAARQSNLLNTDKISAERKMALRRRVNDSRDFQ
eukprot:7850098-Karenia_brevis.AAC.1